ncbi:MAG TPA: phage tail sheath subtilisin-like domain-containing protein [Planctomycetaceae bacterium]|nr:phage tail sheath subtilisin-like domain-containing protein [Planctomycetaceae bacterium]
MTSFAEFIRVFGGFLAEPDSATKLKLQDDGQWWLLAHSVRGFFDNGGLQLYVKRVVANGAAKSSSRLGKGVISEILSDAKDDAKTLRIRHVIGRDTVDKGVKLFNGKTQLPIGDFEISRYSQGPTGCTVLLDKAIGEKVSAARGDYLQFSRDDNVKTLKLAARSEGEWGDSIRVTVRPAVGATLTVKVNEGNVNAPAVSTLAEDAKKPSAGTTWEIKPTAVAGFATGDMVRIDKRKYVLTLENCKQTLTISGTAPTSGGFTLSFKGNKTPSIPHNGTAANIQTALVNLAGIGLGQVVCTGPDLPAGPIVIEFTGTLAGRGIEKLGADNVNLDNGTPTTAIAQEGRTTVDRPGTTDVTVWPMGTEIRKLQLATRAGSLEQVFLSGASRLYKAAMVELDNGTTKQFRTVVDVTLDKVTLDTALPNGFVFVEGDAIQVIEAEVIAEYAPNGIVQESELFQNLKLVSPDKDDPLLITNHLEKRSKLITPLPDASAFLSNSNIADFPLASRLNLKDGDNDFGSLNVNDFIGENNGSGNRTGIQSFEDIEDISIVIVPGMWSETIITELLTHCETMKYRVALIDARYNDSLDKVQEYRSQFDSSRGALYHPWVQVRNPPNGDSVDAPPSGLIAGIFADVDARRGVHKAPANEIIRSITGLQQDITRREQDLLNPKGINALRFFPGRGNRVWGARTISSNSNFRYINVRRIFNFIERSIDEGTQFVVFEPNDETLWATVRQTIGNFLNTQWRAGMLEGKTADEAYFVACDRGATMSQDDIENGRLICQVGIAPVYPAEFVIFRIQKYTADSKLG